MRRLTLQYAAEGSDVALLDSLGMDHSGLEPVAHDWIERGAGGCPGSS